MVVEFDGTVSLNQYSRNMPLAQEQKRLFPLLYFGPIEYYRQLVQNGDAEFILNERFSKQTYRSRCDIMGANGKLTLSIPVHRPYGKMTLMHEVLLSEETPWKQIHWKSIKSAYGRAPYFEYYASLIEQMILYPTTHLNDYLKNLLTETFRLLEMQQIPFSEHSLTNDAQQSIDSIACCKINTAVASANYWQVFQDKHGFIDNLSILDLLFNEGPQAQIFIHR